jgi:tetrapyrrole methylase family protein/MazG family protein
LQKKAAKKGFDWAEPGPVIGKIKEEFDEVQEALAAVDNADEVKPFSAKSDAERNSRQLHVEEELGDLLFAVVNYCRHLGVDPSVALARTNQKFYDRFSYVEQKMKESGTPMNAGTLAKMDELWNEAKKINRDKK